MHAYCEERGIVFLRPESERRSIIERVYRVWLAEVDSFWLFQLHLFVNIAKVSRVIESLVHAMLRLPHTSSDKAVLTVSLVCDPLTNMAVFAFSFSLDSLFFSTRFERAFFGLLNVHKKWWLSVFAIH